MSKNVNKVVLAYSGGLDTSVNLRWLIEKYNCEVIAFYADVGQGEDVEAVREKAMATGASKAVMLDLKEEFVRDFVFPSIRANAVYEGTYLLGTSVSRPCIAKHQIAVAEQEGADAVAHGCTGKGNDQVRFELTYFALNPDITVIAPWRDWEFKGRSDLIAYADKHNIPVKASVKKPYSVDGNLLHRSSEGGILEDPWAAPPEDMFGMTVSPEKAPDKAVEIEVDFEQGNPVAVDGQKMSPADLLCHLNKLGGENGVGRIDIVENRFVGMKSRGVYETPGGTILHIAHRALESITLDREVFHLRDSLIPKFAELVYYGFWFTPEMEMLRAAFDESQQNVTGTVRLKLYKGNCIVLGRKSDFTLYSEDIATFEGDDVYDQADATGFIRLNALRLRVRETMRRRRNS